MKKVKVQGVTAAVLAAGMLLASPVWAAEKPAPAIQEKGGTSVQVAAPQKAAEAPKPELGAAQKKALEKVCQAVPELKGLTVQYISDEGGKTWSVILFDGNPAKDRGIDRVNAHLVFDSTTGELINFNFRNPAWASEKFPSPALAKEKAAAFARQVLGDKIKDYEQGHDVSFGGGGTTDNKGHKIYWAEASVSYHRLVNGVPFMNSGFRVGVDVFGHITNFYREMEEGIDSAGFPDPSRAVSREEAAKTMADMLEMKLQYINRKPSYGPFKAGDKTPALVYAPNELAPIDALTGKPLAGFKPSLTEPQRLTLPGKGRQLIAKTPEEATRLITKVFGVNLTGMEFHGGKSEQPFFDGENKQIFYSWNTPPQKGADGQPDHRQMRFVHLVTNATTGEVLGFNLQDESGRGQKAAISQDIALDKAVKFLNQYLRQGPVELEVQVYSPETDIPDWVNRSKLQDRELPRPVFYVAFKPVHQGVPVMDRTCSVQVDALTGGITGFNPDTASATVSLPDNRNVVTKEKAKAEFLKQHPLELVYIWPEYFNQKSPSPYLVYIPEPDSGFYVDALTGKTIKPENPY